MIKETWNQDETFDIGFNIGKKAKPGEVYCIDGDLGVGKTVITKGIAKGLGIHDNITSPTFTIVNEYTQGRLPLYHFDVYRIADSEEMYEIGFDEYVYGEGVCVVEWATIVKDAIPDHAKWIRIEKNLEKGNDYRKIEIEERK